MVSERKGRRGIIILSEREGGHQGEVSCKLSFLNLDGVSETGQAKLSKLRY